MRPLVAFEVLDARVRSREEKAFVAVIAPPNDVRRRPFFSVDFQDLGVPVGFADVMALDHDPITDIRSHQSSHTLPPTPCSFSGDPATDTVSATKTHLNRRDVSVVVPGALVPCSPGCDRRPRDGDIPYRGVSDAAAGPLL